MTFLQLLTAIATLSLGVAAAVLRRRSGAPSPSQATVTLWLAVAAGSLLVVGVVSHTLLRHVVQIAPLLLALGLLAWRPEWGVAAAAPLFGFWLLIMTAIWLFLLGVARLVSGTFTPVEIALTLIIGAACLLGLRTTVRRGTTLAMAAAISTAAAFAVLQFGAMWLSMQPYLAGR